MLGIPYNGLSFQDEDDGPPTWPPAGSAKLTIEQEINALFFSATWSVRARVDGKIVGESAEATTAIASGLVRQWARAFIRKNYERLRRMGVDANSDYISWGGSVKDLE